MARAVHELAVTTDDDVKLSCSVVGVGPPLVLCHGGPGLWDNLEDLADLLASYFTVWRYDQRGCGRSAGATGPFAVSRFVEDLEAVRQATGHDRVAIGGHSWGAVLALLYASAHPERVSGVLYVAGVGIEWTKWRPMHRAEAERQRALPAYADLANEDPNLVRWAIDFVDPGVGRVRAAEMEASGHRVNVECNAALNEEVSQISESDWLGICGRVKAPVLVLQGERDLRPVAAVDSMVQALPKVQRVVLRGASHYPWVERPQEFVAAVTEWTSRLAMRES